MSQPTVISLFTGAGGLDIGLEVAGFRTVAATDFDPDCVRTLRASQAARIANPAPGTGPFLDHARLIEAPIEEISAADLRPPGSRTWRPDLLAGGPPCQPFSSAGKMKSLDDPRGRLFEHFVRLAAELKPKLILFENVRGLVTAKGPSGRPGEAIFLVKETFESIGYGTNFGLLNAADYGAPQRRVRCFMLASRHEPLPELPAPTHADVVQQSLLGRVLPWNTLGEFLAKLPPPTEFELVRPSPQLAEQLATLPNGTGLKSRGIREATRPGGHWGYKQGTWVADPSRPARTVTAATTQDWIREADGSLRRLTWRECAAIQGFPSDWRFAGTNASKLRQIGNAVPVVFGEAIGRMLIAALAATPRRPQRASSAPFPRSFAAAIDYTHREHARNGPSRAAAKLRAGTVADELLKGLGSADSSRVPDLAASDAG